MMMVFMMDTVQSSAHNDAGCPKHLSKKQDGAQGLKQKHGTTCARQYSAHCNIQQLDQMQQELGLRQLIKT